MVAYWHKKCLSINRRFYALLDVENLSFFFKFGWMVRQRRTNSGSHLVTVGVVWLLSSSIP